MTLVLGVTPGPAIFFLYLSGLLDSEVTFAQGGSMPHYEVLPVAFEKQASTHNDLDVVRGMMRNIYQENPSFWPYGLSPEHCDRDGCFMIRDASTHEPVGFTGWQSRNEGGRKIGYYAIGIVPEHRKSGYAKKAVQGLLAEKAATVDEVRAFIVPGNTPSEALAKSLDIPITRKSASMEKKAISPQTLTNLKKILPILGYGATTAGGMDAIYSARDTSHPFLDHYTDPATFTANRGVQGVLNAVFGGGIRGTMGKMNIGNAPKMTAELVGAPLTKDVLIGAVPALGSLTEAATSSKAYMDAAHKAQVDPNKDYSGLAKGLGIGALGVGGIAALGSLINSYRSSKAMEEMAGHSGPKVRVTLPTKSPGDEETQIEMPLSQMTLSKTLQTALQRDTKRRLRGESASRTLHKLKAINDSAALPA